MLIHCAQEDMRSLLMQSVVGSGAQFWRAERWRRVLQKQDDGVVNGRLGNCKRVVGGGRVTSDQG